MCLITKQKKAFIAKENIVVYKLVNKRRASIFSEYGRVVYNDGDVIEREIKESTSPAAFKLNKWANDLKVSDSYITSGMKAKNLTAYGSGIHIFMKLERAKKVSQNCYTILECIIPAGSKYYVDETGLGITEKLTVIKQITS